MSAHPGEWKMTKTCIQVRKRPNEEVRMRKRKNMKIKRKKKNHRSVLKHQGISKFGH